MGLNDRDRRIAALAVPALGTLAVEPLYVLVDTAIVGRLGVVPLGGLALATTVLTTFFLGCNFLAYGTTARVAFLTGRGDERGGAEVAAQALWLALVIGGPAALVAFVAARPMVGALGGSGAVAAAAVTYLRISALGVPAVLVALVGHGYLRGRSDIRTPLLVAAAANLLNLVLELVLVYGFDLGVRGSAWGTVVAQTLAAVAFLVVIGRRVEASRAGLRPIGAEMGRLLLAGRRLIVRTAALLAALTLASAVAARVGAATLGGHQIALQVHSFIALALDALAIPGQILVGTLLGAGDFDEARAVARRLLTVGVACGTLIGAALALSAWWLPAVFSHDPLVRRRATVALLIAGAVQVPAAVAFVLDGVLIGGSDFGALQRGVVFGLIVYLPLAALVLRFHRLGVAGVWAGLLVWMLGRAGANWRRYRSGRWITLPST